jgi:hypothetical protein
MREKGRGWRKRGSGGAGEDARREKEEGGEWEEGDRKEGKAKCEREQEISFQRVVFNFLFFHRQN